MTSTNDDLIEALILLMDTADDFTGPINIGNPREFTILELAEQVVRLIGTNSKIIFKPLPADDPRQRQPDIALAESKLGWRPTTELAQGLERTIRYFQQAL